MHAALIESAAMKWYKRDPNAALAGMAGLTLEECGAYNLVIDAYYARDGHLPDDDYLVSRILHCDPRCWRRLKLALFQKQKLTISGGNLIPNRGEDTLREAQSFGKSKGVLPGKLGPKFTPKRVEKGNEINGAAHTPTTTSTFIESSLGKGREEATAQVVPKPNLPPVIDYRDPGNDYRSPPRTKPDLPPLTDEQRRAAAVLRHQIHTEEGTNP